MRIILSLILLAMFCSCSTRKLVTLEEDKTINAIFSSGEINDLTKILEFFDSQICEGHRSDGNELLRCYQNFFVKMDSAEATGDIDPHLSFEQQLQLYKRISDSTFSQIWRFSKSWKGYPPSDTLKRISFNESGKYWLLLRELGKEDSFVKNYHNSFERAGDISPSMVAGMLKLYQRLDTKDIRVRLMIAIHYLTLNDQYLRDEKFGKS